MFRYVGLVWDTKDPTQCTYAMSLSHRVEHAKGEWHTTVETSGLRVLCSGSRQSASEPYPLQGESGVVLGTVFRRSPDDRGVMPRAIFGDRETEAIVLSRAEALVQQYWGRYVAFVAGKREMGPVHVLRSPVEAFPCYYLRTRSVYVFFSDINDCESLGLGPFSVNWDYLRAHIFAGHLPPSELTALREICSVRPGECLEINRGQVTKVFYWKPFSIAAAENIEDSARAADELRQTAVQCAHAWSSGHTRILHRLSGGLDSNIVLACMRLSRPQPAITCLNYHSEGSDSDERVLARVGANAAGCNLVEQPRNSALRLEPILNLAKAPEPTFYIGFLEISQREADLASEVGATAISDGGGGDPLFYQARASFAAGDYVFRHGLRPSLFGIAYSAARLEHLSIGEVLRRSVDEGLRGRMWNPQKELTGRRHFQCPDMFEGAERFLTYPCADGIEAVPSGKRWHILGLAYPFNFYDPFGRENDPEQVHALMSQPLVELALRIPTYVLTHGGVWDRALARRAFSRDLPTEIAWRRTKGGMEEHARALLLLNIEFIRETILNGVLVRMGLIDRSKVEAFLTLRPDSGSGGGMHEIFEYLNIEAWLSKMSSSACAVAA